MDTTPAPGSPGPVTTEAPDTALVEFLGGEVEEAAPAPESQAPEAGQPKTPAADQPRDEQGRFVTAEPTSAAPEAPEAQEPASPVVPTPTPDIPFSYRAYGADHSPFPGAVIRNGEIVFPAAVVPRLRQFMAEGHNAESRRRETERAHQQALQAAQAARAEVVERADLTLARLAELRRDPQALADWFNDLDRNWAILEAQVERDALKKQLDQQTSRVTEADQERQAAELAPKMQALLAETVDEMIAREPTWQHLDRAGMTDRLWTAFFDRVFYEAQEDDPQAGVTAGELVIDYDAIARELRYEAGLRKPPTPATAPAPTAKVAATPAKEAAPPPPVVGTKGAGARAGSRVPKFKTTEEADEWFSKGGYHDL